MFRVGFGWEHGKHVWLRLSGEASVEADIFLE